MIVENAFEHEMVNHEDHSTLNNLINSSGQICSTELIDTSIEDVRNKKKTLVSRIDSVISLMREVECEEKLAEQAKEAADWSSLDILVKVDERKQALQQAKEINDMLVRNVNVHKAVLATKMEVLQLRMTRLLVDGDRSVAVLDEISRSLEMRLTSALRKKELAFKKKQDNEAFSQVVLAYEDFQIEKMVEESKRWKQEALKIFKLLEVLKDHGHAVEMLQGEISDECQNVNQLKEELDQTIPLGGIISFNKKISILAASNSSIKSSKLEGNKNVVFEADIKNPHVISTDITEEGHAMSNDGFVALQSTIECNEFGENPRDATIREVNKRRGDQMFAKSIKKVKIKNRLHGNQKIVKCIKKVKIKGLQVVLKRSAAADHREDCSDEHRNSNT